MNTPVATETERDVSEGRSGAIPGRESPLRENFVERWLQKNWNVLAPVVVAAGFALRLFTATRSYLSPDEALHYLLINQSSAWLAYKASLTNAHPPLIFLILYVWHLLGRSEVMLRLPSVLLGTAFCWVAFKWVSAAFGRTAGLISLILFTFSPAMVSLSAEVRGYALMLFCMAAALYFLARAFEEKSSGKMWCFSIFLYLAILSHYSALFFTVALGVYVLARSVDGQLPRKAVVAWALGQLGALAVYVFLYVTHVSKLKTMIALWSMPFEGAYFHPDSGNIFTFTKVNTLNIFVFLFAQQYVAITALLALIAGTVILFGKDLLSHRDGRPSSRLGILLFLPFAAVWGAALAGIYPYVGSRHTVFLAPFAIAGASYLLAAICRQKLSVGLLLAFVLMAFSIAAVRPVDELNPSKGDLRPAVMASAVKYMNATIPKGDLILVDFQSSLPATYYLCGPKVMIPMETWGGEYHEFACDGYPVISLHIWKVIAQSFSRQFQNMAQSHGLRPGERVWVFQSGWGADLGAELPGHDPKFRCLSPKNFGGSVTVIPFVVDQDLSPALPPGSCANQ